MLDRAERFARQLVLKEVGREGQLRLAAARVLVVGCGGLAAPVVPALAAAGVGHLTLLDDDVVEPSNLNRQTLFTAADTGLRKAERAAAWVRSFDPGIDVAFFVRRLGVHDARDLVKAHDLVVDCTDGLPTKFLLNDACVLEDVRLVHGAATAWAGQAMVVPGRRGPCLRCLFEDLPPEGSVPSCRDAGIVGAVCTIVGGFMATEALKALLGIDGLVGRFLAVDGLGPDVRALKVARDPACRACGDAPDVDARTPQDYELARCD